LPSFNVYILLAGCGRGGAESYKFK